MSRRGSLGQVGGDVTRLRAARDKRSWHWHRKLAAWPREARTDIAAVLLCFIFTAALMAPTLFSINERLYGTGNDGIGAPYVIAQRLNATEHGGLFAAVPSLLGAPFPYVDAGLDVDPLWWYAGVLLAHVFSPVGATNILILLGFLATYVAMYSLLRLCHIQPAPALLGALIYDFCPIRLAEAQEHFLLLDDFWLVLEGAILLTLARTKLPTRWAVALGLCIGLAELDSPYLGYFACILAAGWFVCRLGLSIVGREWRYTRMAAWQGMIAMAALVMLLVPTQLPALLAPKALAQVDRPLADLNRYSLRWWDFFLPFPENPILGPLGRSTFKAHAGASTVTEASVMTGYIALILAMVGVSVTMRCRRRVSDLAMIEPASISAQQEQRELALTAGVCIVTGVLFGLPPLFHVGSLTIPSPSYFAHAIFPEIRTLSRIDLIIQLGVAILAALGAQALLSRIHSTSRRHLLASALVVGVLLEYTDVPPWRYIKLLPAPGVYHWLATLSAQQAGIVVQYPLVSAESPLYAFYAYVIHHHPLFNGVVPGTPPDALRRNLEDPLNPTAPASLAALGVKTVVMNTADFNRIYGARGLHWTGQAPNLESRLPVGLQLEYVGVQFRAYRITAAPTKILAGLLSDTSIRRDGRIWQWVGAATAIWVDNVTHETIPAMLWTQVHNNRDPHAVLVPGYQPIPVSLASDATPVALPVFVPPGMHAIPLRILGPDQPLAGTGNPAPVTVEVRSLEPAPVRSLTASFVQDGHVSMMLTAMSTDACAATAGSTVDIALLWRSLHPTTVPYTVFVHLLNATGHLVATGDGLPDFGGALTNILRPGSQVSDVHILALPSTLPPGTYHLTVGLYNHVTGTRLATTTGKTEMTVGTIDVLPRSAGPRRMACRW